MQVVAGELESCMVLGLGAIDSSLTDKGNFLIYIVHIWTECSWQLALSIVAWIITANNKAQIISNLSTPNFVCSKLFQYL